MQINGRKVLGAMVAMALAGCAAGPRADTGGSGDDPRSRISATDPDARAFTGTIISLRPMTSTMLISKDEHHGDDAFPNQIRVKYDADTKFFLDGQPATLDQLQQYMTVEVAGHMRQGQMFAETVKFSSVLPKNVRRAATESP